MAPTLSPSPFSRLACVTGASGHVGNVLVRELLAQGATVRALVMPGDSAPALAGLDCKRVVGDLKDPASLERAFESCEWVFHVAGAVSIGTGDDDRLWAVNTEGTRNVIAACRKAGVRRLIYTSSVHALVEPRSGWLTESAGFRVEAAHGGYAKSKAAATLAVLEAAREDLDAVVVCPSGVIGPFDSVGSELGHVLERYARGEVPFCVKGGYDFVDVRDVAKGHLLAATRGRRGEVYLLNSEWISVREMFEALTQATGRRAPRVTLPLWVAKAWAPIEVWQATRQHRRPQLTPYAAYTLGAPYRVDDSKARRELGYTSRPVREALVDASRWLAAHPLTETLTKMPPSRGATA